MNSPRNKDSLARGPLLVAGGAALLSLSPVLVHMGQAVGPNTSGVWRTLLGGVVLVLAALLRGERLFRGWASLGLACLTGFFFALDLTLWHRSVYLVGPGLSTILVGFQVFVLGLAGLAFLGESISWRLGIAIPMALLGLYMLVGLPWIQGGEAYRKGVIYGLSAALALAAYILCLRKLQDLPGSSGHIANMAQVSLACALCMAMEATRLGEPLFFSGVENWLVILAYGIICQAAAGLFYSFGMPKTPALQVGLLLLLQPTLAFIWDIWIFARPTTGLEISGATLAIAAIYLGSTRSRR